MIAPAAMDLSAGALDWAVFAAVVLFALGFDRAVFGRGTHMSFREAAARSIVTISIGLLFSVFIFARHGTDQAVTYLVAYIVEESLSVDNLFVFLVIFSYFGLTEKRQHRVLFWGIWGAIVMRGIFIVAGSALLARFHWLMYLFGIFLIWTGLKLAFRKEEEVNPEDNVALKLARRFLKTTKDFEGDAFFVVKDGVRRATPLFLVLVVIEFSDVLFAVDSVPAVLAISNNIFIIYTSNIMAILGLRSLYFVLSGMMDRFHYLGTGLAVILLFIGLKMVGTDFVKVAPFVSLGVIGGVLAIAVLASLLRPPSPPAPPEARREEHEPTPEQQPADEQ
jgi:TerC family integral membrane protein